MIHPSNLKNSLEKMNRLKKVKGQRNMLFLKKKYVGSNGNYNIKVISFIRRNVINDSTSTLRKKNRMTSSSTATGMTSIG